MLKNFYIVLFVAVICLNSFAVAQSQSKSEKPNITKAEAQEAQDFAKKFTARFLETKDLAPLLDEFYFSDFIDRYKKFQSLEDNKSVNSLFVPGLTYHFKIIAEGNSDDWHRFYVSAHNFILLPVIAMLKNAKENPENKADFDVVKFYSPSVVSLLDKNPNLANMIKKQGSDKPVGSAEEMRNATAVLEQALTIIREKQASLLVLKIDDKQLTKVFQKEYFKPELEIADADEFGFPKNTRFITINTPIGMQLMLAKDGNKLKIVWATMSLD